jgi:hypothetical protein
MVDFVNEVFLSHLYSSYRKALWHGVDDYFPFEGKCAADFYKNPSRLPDLKSQTNGPMESALTVTPPKLLKCILDI